VTEVLAVPAKAVDIRAADRAATTIFFITFSYVQHRYSRLHFTARHGWRVHVHSVSLVLN
ncbi:hypothetical protein, partial [Deinococcus aerophilus]|uniref:hypothetical protein n=1 Tax=Deinococcus aerophilus TaxID=522488 RepID=UPI001E485EE1